LRHPLIAALGQQGNIQFIVSFREACMTADEVSW
jgi:hypothetical protein